MHLQSEKRSYSSVWIKNSEKWQKTRGIEVSNLKTPQLYEPLCRSVGPSVCHTLLFFAKWLIVSRERVLWRSALFVGLSTHRYVHTNATCTFFYFLQERARTGMVDANTTVEICPRGPNVTVMKITPWMRTAKHAGVGDMQPWAIGHERSVLFSRTTR